ncbi:RPA family protein [Halalkalicoccus sp. NIPERK01]|uniref:RPA family protein n=1 Tax=Halalkalicoccus sp. NIPERK01 TaxID=3053469 RepID=UPI00256F0458|nr:hypothetical protein [Halalkalicoccus sp. NIPERK01]MDL5360850.1 hypothetical protein [Halalkalicoccus sp. NIPERK01]
MSANGNGGGGGDSGPGRREVAHRLFATEFDASSLEYADSDEERAPKYVITPTGARVNRLFAVGVLTEVQRVNDEVVRARVVDPTGAFVVYAGQYQPDALAFLERADPPTFVAVTGKANTFRPEDSDRVYTSVRPESIAEVDAETRDRWTVQAAEHTLRRIGEFARALETDSGASDRRDGIALAREEYGTTPAYLAALRETALDAARLVAGAVEEATPPAIEPGADDGRTVDLVALHDAEASEPASVGGAEADTPTSDGTDSEPEPGAATDIESEPEPDATGFEMPEQESEDGTGKAPAEPSGATDDADGETAGVPETATAEAESDERSDSDDLGDFDVPESEPAASEPVAEGDAETVDEGELYEFDAEERAEIEAEFDMEFSSGSEVDDPGEAGIDVPEPEGGAEIEDGDATTDPGTEVDTADEPSDEGEVDVEDRAMEVMRDLADGDGADREAVVDRVANEAGVAPEAVDDAIESALLSGRCYEPQDDVLKPI